MSAVGNLRTHRQSVAEFEDDDHKYAAEESDSPVVGINDQVGETRNQ